MALDPELTRQYLRAAVSDEQNGLRAVARQMRRARMQRLLNPAPAAPETPPAEEGLSDDEMAARASMMEG